MNRFWHRVLLLKYDYSDLKFLNYGYASLDPTSESLGLHESDEMERYCLQLYNHTISGVDLKGKDVLEVGSGRGGGASFITRYYEPKSYTGLDLSKKLIRFCNKNCSLPNLSFVYGNAENLLFDDKTFDAIVNIESSRDYCHVDIFLTEAYRVLRPGGFLLLSDLRTIEGMELLRNQIKEAGFDIIEEENITQNTLKALDLDYERRYNLVLNAAPSFLEKIGKEWSGLRGSERYESFVEGSLVYLRYKLKKQ
jgi:SAM-dependent methyltransferase